MSVVYVLSHLGLGDNITSIGMVNFLKECYDHVYLLCKKQYADNVKLIVGENSVLTVDDGKEVQALIPLYEKGDVIVTGWVYSRIRSKITNKYVIDYTPHNNQYNLKYDHIKYFYEHIGLDTRIYVDYFDIPSTEDSKYFYNQIKHKKIVFAHTKASSNEINIDEKIDNYIGDDSYIVICANKNVYNSEHTANKFVNLPVQNYIDIIKNSFEIHVIDSCFSCIVYPLVLKNILNPECVFIYQR
jgi:hypothetical protein